MMRSPIPVLVRRDLTRLLKDKAVVFMVCSQLVLISLSLTFSHFLPIIASGDMPVPKSFALVCVVGDDAFWAAFSNDSMFERNDLQAGSFYLHKGTYDALITSEDYGLKVNGTTPIQVDVYVRENSRKSAVIARAKSILEGAERKVRADRLTVHGAGYTEYGLAENPPAPFSSYIYTVLLPFFILFLAIGAGNMTITLMANEVEEETLETLLSAPLTYRDLLISKSSTSLAVVLIQLAFWAIAFLAAGVYLANPLVILVLAFAYVVVFVSLGLICFSLGGSRDAAQNIYAVFMLPGVVVLMPVQSLPALLRGLIDIMPTRLIAQTALDTQISGGVAAGCIVTAAASAVLYAAAIILSGKRTIY